MRIAVLIPLLVAFAEISASEPTKHDTLSQVTRVLSAANDTSKSCPELFPEAKDAVSLCQTVKTCYGKPGEENRALCELIVEEFRGQNEGRQEKAAKVRPSSAAVWGYGILCVTLISMMSVLGVAVMPFMSKSFYTSMLTCLIGLAVGSLSGSAVFHLIPSAFKLADLVEHHAYLEISLVIFGGIYMFFIIERLLKMIMDIKSRKQGITFHGHSHNGITEGTRLTGSEDRTPGQDSLDPIIIDPEGDGAGGCAPLKKNEELYQDSQQAIRSSFGHQDRPTPNTRPTVEGVKTIAANNATDPANKEPAANAVATVAWMIIFGDGVHNFIDGLSIGAAFSESILTGMSVSLAVLCEEFPHELGDFAVLLNSGMTMKQALSYNFLSACTCYLGLFIGIVLGELEFANQYIFGLAGGMFLYIALVDMVPEMNETTDKQTTLKSAGFTFLLQNIGMLVGIFSLYVLAKFQDDIVLDL